MKVVPTLPVRPGLVSSVHPADLVSILDGTNHVLECAERHRFVTEGCALALRTRIKAIALRVEELADQLQADVMCVSSSSARPPTVD